MGARLPNERMDASDPALPVFESKGERTIASSANQPGRPKGMVLPWLMTMPSPREDINLATSARAGTKNWKLRNLMVWLKVQLQPLS